MERVLARQDPDLIPGLKLLQAHRTSTVEGREPVLIKYHHTGVIMS